MSEIVMSMDERWIPDIERGDKTATTRTKRKGSVGDTFVLNGRRYVLTRVLPQPLWAATGLFYESEGFRSADEFKDALLSYYPDIDDGTVVYIHFFREAME